MTGDDTIVFALMVFAFSALSSFAGASISRALASTAFGLWLATVGLDPNSAIPRYTFGQIHLLDGYIEQDVITERVS